MNGARAVWSLSLPALLACALACAGAHAADAPASAPAPADVAASAPATAASAPADAASAVDDKPRTALVPVPGGQPIEIPAPLANVSAPTVPVADSVPGGKKVERVQVTDPYIELHTFAGRG